MRKIKVAQSHVDDELPPARAADCQREAELSRLLASGTLVETFRKKPVKIPTGEARPSGGRASGTTGRHQR